MNHRIKSATWFQCHKGKLLGCVLVETLPDVYKCYLGPVADLPPGQERNEEEDENYVYAYGAIVLPHIARAIFPQSVDYKFYED